MPTINLFVPCYVDQLFPEIGVATSDLLRRAGCEVRFDQRQTCCGQPMANSGCQRDAAVLARRHLDVFRGGITVCPSGSCVAMVRHHYQHLGLDLSDADLATMANTFELSEFLVEQVRHLRFGARFPHRVALHHSCHGLRELRLGGSSECAGPIRTGPAEALLAQVAGLEVVRPRRRDECCGFGGTFAVAEPGLSVRMGEDRCADYTACGAEWITATDVSCLMHLGGVAARRGGPKTIHLAEILAAV